MGTEYLFSLSNEDKVRYNDKLTLANGVKLEDPYAITTGWLADISKLPNITWSNVIKYLVDTPSEYTKEAVKAFKSLDGFEFFREGHVQDCFYHETCAKSFCFIKSKVRYHNLMLLNILFSLWFLIDRGLESVVALGLL